MAPKAKRLKNKGAPAGWLRKLLAQAPPGTSKAELEKLARMYEDWHWSAKPDKVIVVRDKLVPNLVGIGKLVELTTDRGVLTFKDGSWIGFDPKHPHQRMHLVLSKKAREQVRKAMKEAGKLYFLQELATSTGGTHAKYPMPRLKAAPIGVLRSVVYDTYKVGEENDGRNLYEHTFGHEGGGGVCPILAADSSGRCWLAGGSYVCPNPGITR